MALRSRDQSSDVSSSISPRSGFRSSISRSSFDHSDGKSSNSSGEPGRYQNARHTPRLTWVWASPVTSGRVPVSRWLPWPRRLVIRRWSPASSVFRCVEQATCLSVGAIGDLRNVNGISDPLRASGAMPGSAEGRQGSARRAGRVRRLGVALRPALPRASVPLCRGESRRHLTAGLGRGYQR